jgi:hypothetical protein
MKIYQHKKQMKTSTNANIETQKKWANDEGYNYSSINM